MPVNKIFVGGSVQEAFDRLVDQINTALRRMPDASFLEERVRKLEARIEAARSMSVRRMRVVEQPGADLPPVANLTVLASEVDPEGWTVRFTLRFDMPTGDGLSGVRVYVETPDPSDTDPANPTLPGSLSLQGSYFVEAGVNRTITAVVPLPPASVLNGWYAPPAPLQVRFILYVLTEGWDACAPLRRLSGLNPPAPPTASPWTSALVDLTDIVVAGAQEHLGPSIAADTITVEVVEGRAQIRMAYTPVYPSVSLAAVHAYTSTPQNAQNAPHGRWPYEGTGTTIPEAYGWVRLDVPLPASLPVKVAVQLAGEWADGYTRIPVRIAWENGEPQNVPAGWGTVVTISADTVTLGAPSVAAAAVEYRQTEGGWSYRFVVTLAGPVLTQPQYGGSDIYVRFANEQEPGDPGGWAQLRGIAEHRPGDSPTVYSPWWPIRPGTSIQFWLRAVARDRSGIGRAWGPVAGPYSLHLPFGDTVPGIGHVWNFTAQLNGYWDDGNGIRLGKVDLSWTPLPIPGVLYGVYEYRSPESEPPLYSLYKPTEANTAESSVTLWVPPPAGSGEYLHLALVAQLPADGVWPHPADYPAGQLPVASVWLPVAGLSDQVTNWQVTVETDQTDDVPRGRFVFSFTPPVDPDFHHVHVYRRPANAQGEPIADWLPDKVASIMTGGPGGWWPLPSQPEYWLFKAVACNSLGQENPASPPTVFVAVPTSAGVTAKKVSPVAVAGPISVDSLGRVTIVNGALQASHIGTVNADSITGLITAGQIGSVNAGSITGVIVTQQLADQILNTARLLGQSMSVPVKVTALPALPDPEWPPGALALRITDKTLWKNVGNVWTAAVPSSELTGHLTATDIISINASQIVGLITAGQIQNITAEQIVGTISGDKIDSISGSKIEVNSITADKIASIDGSKIQVNSITSDKIASIHGSKIQAGSISADKIAEINASTITIGTLNAGQISSISAQTIISNINDQVPNLWVAGVLQVGGGINIAGTSNLVCQDGDVYCNVCRPVDIVCGDNISCGSLDVSYNINCGSLHVGNQLVRNAAFRNVGSGANEVAAGNHTHTEYAVVTHTHNEYAGSSHTHTVTVTLSVEKTTISYVDPYDNNYVLDVVTDVSVQSVTCSGPQ